MIVLASASPRRHDLLSRAGLSFTVEVSDVDEHLESTHDASRGACELALRKARAVAERLAPQRPTWVLGADTIVALPTPDGQRFLGKPADEDEARGMLRCLSDSCHSVVTGVCVLCLPEGRVETSSETTRVTMRTLSPAEIEAYVASGEWRDKAGGYAIQESADAFVLALEGGGFDNVVGLPVARTLQLLAACGEPQARAALADPPGRG